MVWSKVWEMFVIMISLSCSKIVLIRTDSILFFKAKFR